MRSFVLGLVLCGGCFEEDDSGTGDMSPDALDAGRGAVTYSGEVSGEIVGPSRFFKMEQGNATCMIRVDDDTLNDEVILAFAHDGGVRPPVGTYTAGEGAGMFAPQLQLDGSSQVFYTLNVGGAAGTVEITKSDVEALEGTFEFTAGPYRAEATTVTVSGAFRAAPSTGATSNDAPCY